MHLSTDSAKTLIDDRGQYKCPLTVKQRFCIDKIGPFWASSEGRALTARQFSATHLFAHPALTSLYRTSVVKAACEGECERSSTQKSVFSLRNL
jgi:hypothetical protein